jgi:hypothetical protein
MGFENLIWLRYGYTTISFTPKCVIPQQHKHDIVVIRHIWLTERMQMLITLNESDVSNCASGCLPQAIIFQPSKCMLLNGFSEVWELLVLNRQVDTPQTSE